MRTLTRNLLIRLRNRVGAIVQMLSRRPPEPWGATVEYTAGEDIPAYTWVVIGPDGKIRAATKEPLDAP